MAVIFCKAAAVGDQGGQHVQSSSPAASGELRDNQDVVIRHANMASIFIILGSDSEIRSPEIHNDACGMRIRQKLVLTHASTLFSHMVSPVNFPRGNASPSSLTKIQTCSIKELNGLSKGPVLPPHRSGSPKCTQEAEDWVPKCPETHKVDCARAR